MNGATLYYINRIFCKFHNIVSYRHVTPVLILSLNIPNVFDVLRKLNLESTNRKRHNYNSGCPFFSQM